MEHVLTYKIFSNKYENFNISDLSVENFDEVFNNLELLEGKFKLFKKLKIWAISPKVKKLQKKANVTRLKSVKEEVGIIKKTIAAINKNRDDVDLERIKQLLIKKSNVAEKVASSYESEAATIADGNEYLLKVMRVELMKGEMDINNVRMQTADEEEEEALNNINNEAAKLIREDIGDIKSKMKDPNFVSDDAKGSKQDNSADIPDDIDWKDLMTADMTNAEKEAIITKKYRPLKTDVALVKNWKRARMRSEKQWVLDKKATNASFHDRESIIANNIEKLAEMGITFGQTEYDKWQEEQLKGKKKKKK